MPREQFIAPAGAAAGDPFLLLGFLPLGLPGWSGFAALLQPGVSRPFLPPPPPPHASRRPRQTLRPRWTTASRRQTPRRPLDPLTPPAPLPLPIGKSAQIETFVAARDAKLFR